MQKPPGLKYFDELEDKIESALNTLQGRVTKGAPELLGKLHDLLGQFTKVSGNLKQNSENIRLLNQVSKQVDAILSESALLPATREFLQAIPEAGELVNSYFATMLTDVADGKAVYKAITEFYTNYTANALVGQGVNQQFKQGILDVLRQSVKNGISTTEAKKLLAQHVVGDNRLAKQVSQVASDALHQYSREYTQVLTDDLGLQHYYYKGTKIATTRGFCGTRTGKYYTQKEVESWAALSWPGKIGGTNKSNIKTLLGGWNCRHLLVPVSKAVYDARVNANKAVEATPKAVETVSKTPEKVKAFTPAKTIKEAESFALNEGLSKEKFNYSKVDLDTANQINETLYSNKQEFGIVYDKINIRSGGRAKSGQFATNGRRFNVETGETTGYELFINSDEIMRSEVIKEAFAEGHWMAQNVKDIINHEYGHRLTKDITVKLSQAERSKTIFKTTKYSTFNLDESLAEIFGIYKQGKASPEMVEFFNKYSIVKIKK